MENTEYTKAEKKALELIARAEQTAFGLRRKLEKRGFNAACIDAVISNLIEQNLLNDRRYAQMWLNTRLRLPRSPRRLLIALCAKGIDREEAQAALKEALDEETEAALLARFVKKYEKKISKAEEPKRHLKFLLKNEGFSADAIENYLFP